jgi:hypothetical protein
MYNATIEQMRHAVDLCLFDELNAHILNCAEWSTLNDQEKGDAREFARILFEEQDKSNIWDFGVYC